MIIVGVKKYERLNAERVHMYLHNLGRFRNFEEK